MSLISEKLRLRRVALDKELEALNTEVEAVLAKRKAWLDENMAAYSKYQVGETIFDMNTGRKLGVITGLYRYHAGDPKFDTSLWVHYKYREAGYDDRYRFINNTSSQPNVWIGNFAELKQYRESQADRMRFMKSDGSTDWAALFALQKETPDGSAS